jgi:hypothetical protein
MHLTTKLIEKNLESHYQKTPGDIVVHSFHCKGKEYFLTVRHLRTLQTIIKDKIESIIELEDEKFTVAGGSILTLLMYGSPFLIRDIDIFPCSEIEYKKLKAKFDLVAKDKKIDIYENGNSRSYKFSSCTIDLIKKFYETPKDCLNAFDINVCKVGFEAQNNFYFHRSVDLGTIFGFRMDFVNPITRENAYVSLRRVMKYSAKGFEMGKQKLMEFYASIVSGEPSSIKIEKDGWSTQEVNPVWKEKYDEAFKQHTEGYHHLTPLLTKETPDDFWMLHKSTFGEKGSDLA